MRLTYQDYLAKLSLSPTSQTRTKADIVPSGTDLKAKLSTSDSLTLSDEAKARFAQQQNEISENQKQQALSQAANVLMGSAKSSKQNSSAQNSSAQSAQDEITQAQIKYLKDQIKQAKTQLQKLAYKKHEGADKQRAMLNMSVVMMTGQLLELMRNELPDASKRRP
ncbi:hypothetical protein [Motilimonas eburnea]|uniref:hypothetical protein n=1 Tax=Motilimonas eburnea TaxID=1737488 RepID=UPI001E498751|nr:hypothetical protein [Motilimonas eburnea]MCE2570257.1 hypothetical protein [Motilimonas eburnea]